MVEYLRATKQSNGSNPRRGCTRFLKRGGLIELAKAESQYLIHFFEKLLIIIKLISLVHQHLESYHVVEINLLTDLIQISKEEFQNLVGND